MIVVDCIDQQMNSTKIHFIIIAVLVYMTIIDGFRSVGHTSCCLMIRYQFDYCQGDMFTNRICLDICISIEFIRLDGDSSSLYGLRYGN
jgi:hypothetical protein